VNQQPRTFDLATGAENSRDPSTLRTMRLPRRSLLKLGLAGVPALLLAGVGVAAVPTRLVALPPSGLRVLSHAEYSVLAAIVDRICPPLGEGAPGASARDVARTLDNELAHLDAEIGAAFKILLTAFENGLVGALFGERLRPFTRLAPPDQDVVLAAWRSSSVGARRTAFKILKSMTAAVYFSEASTWQRIGYPGPPPAATLRAGYAANLVDYESLRAQRGSIAPAENR
jgi:hypothetical protein